ncbi:hypothetical protein K523DRAFT_410766 [Schizophyllum commune Tattone D]|nr:hypothetical protein K523DRAFT_410766 [Schizophyllum commune Tattone D]
MPRDTKPLPEGFIPLTRTATRIKCTLCHYNTTMRISSATTHIKSSGHQTALRYIARQLEKEGIDDDRAWCEERFKWEAQARLKEHERQKRDEEEEAAVAKEREGGVVILPGWRWM